MYSPCKNYFSFTISDGVTIKIPCAVDVLHQPALRPIFPHLWLKLNLVLLLDQLRLA